MRKRLIDCLLSMLAEIMLTSCGQGRDHATNNEAKSHNNRPSATLALASNAFGKGGPIPAQFTCDGANAAPSLRWGEPPQGTKSFAIIMDDHDAPGGTFRHWGVIDIPPSSRSLGKGQYTATELINDFGRRGYSGPCPPKGDMAHHYRLKLFALDVAHLEIGEKAKVANAEQLAVQHRVGQGALMGTYARRRA